MDAETLEAGVGTPEDGEKADAEEENVLAPQISIDDEGNIIINEKRYDAT